MSSNAHPTDAARDVPMVRTSEDIHVELTHSALDTRVVLNRIKSPEAGANVLFLGTTRNNFDSRPVARLSYEAYVPLALKTFYEIAESTLKKHNLTRVCIVHRLGHVPVGEESIAIAVSSPHRKSAWAAGEQTLEQCKERAEIWKREDFADEEAGGEWRANRDRDSEGKIVSAK
ncbi:MAG: hypothetical protein Q9227_006522 [Pyrenula ochraceoflavens]